MNKNLIKKLVQATLMVIILMTCTVSPATLAQVKPAKVCVVGEPVITSFPTISVEFLAVDDAFNNITYLQQKDIQVSEEGQLYNISNLSSSESGTGLNLYFVIDRGNRTDPRSVKSVMARFANQFALDGVDRISIISSAFTEDPLMRLFGPDDTIANFSKSVTNLSSSSLQEPMSPADAMQAAINGIRGDGFGCSKPNIIVAITGEDVFAKSSDFTKVISEAQQTNTRIFIVNTINTSYNNQTDYEKIALDTKGLYLPLRSTFSETSSDLDNTLFAALNNARFTYTAEYRTQAGLSGVRTLSMVIGGVETSSESASSSYSINLLPPTVTITNPNDGAIILRTAQDLIDSDYIYDKFDQLIEWQIEWPDSHPRNLEKITIVMTTATGDETIASFSQEEINSSNFLWDLRSIIAEGDNPRTLRIDVVDELGLSSSGTTNVIVTNSIPSMVGIRTSKLVQWQLYALYGFLGLLVIFFFIFFKKIKRAFSAGGAIGDAIENVRKTIVGGRGHRRNPIAKMEVIRPTQETKSIFTESVKLGRDPKVADYTFFTLNSECSVSGEHAQLVKKREGWVIIGVSSSKSPVFVDGKQIKLHEEVPLKDGSVIELGYEDLGSALFRFVEVAPSDTPAFFPPDETTTEIDEDGYKKTQVLITDPKNNNGEAQETNVLLGELDTFNDMTKDQDDFDMLFDDLRGK